MSRQWLGYGHGWSRSDDVAKSKSCGPVILTLPTVVQPSSMPVLWQEAGAGAALGGGEGSAAILEEEEEEAEGLKEVAAEEEAEEDAASLTTTCCCFFSQRPALITSACMHTHRTTQPTTDREGGIRSLAAAHTLPLHKSTQGTTTTWPACAVKQVPGAWYHCEASSPEPAPACPRQLPHHLHLALPLPSLPLDDPKPSRLRIPYATTVSTYPDDGGDVKVGEHVTAAQAAGQGVADASCHRLEVGCIPQTQSMIMIS